VAVASLTVTSPQINDYANSMFRFERLNEPWIASCATYLQAMFGSRLVDATVIDYAFGRGNWSLAFRRAGAARVIAIDAAEDNVRRFSGFCADHGVTGIEVIHGNVLDRPIDVTADVVWLYGILPCIADVDAFLRRVTEFRRPGSAYVVYSYDRGSLRQFVVDAARQVLTYASEAAFVPDSLLLTRAARHRARDDLIAPWVAWNSAAELQGRLSTHGLYPAARLADFPEFLAGKPSEEFEPHLWRCSLDAGDEIVPRDPPRPHGPDLALLGNMVDALWGQLGEQDARRAALGLFNTHFEALRTSGTAEAILVDDFMFLTYVSLVHDVPPTALTSPTSDLRDLALAALAAEQGSRDLPESLRASLIARHLRENRIRL
jgi:predicted RNA methylase